MIKLLLKEGADITIPSNCGWTSVNLTSTPVTDSDRAEAKLPSIIHRTYRGGLVTSLDAADGMVAIKDEWTLLDPASFNGTRQVGMAVASLWQCLTRVTFLSG